ncbi:HNH endonuclease [Tenacibaculum tangerinum]|uniref:HNH endonuclease n=1 Tax=Tenacibaculum tangerinum TaxID=3038772 RepID=A0ABY8KZL0_9FLAO|nr:HNH endonuclease [Tenacibaculum tangerinum]WGH74649.1 HNH endonuclease [Tenacibaculum tangerinum]
MADNVGKLIEKTFKFGIDTFVKLAEVIADFIKNIPKHLNDLKKWIGEFIASLKGFVNQIFKGLEATLDLLYDLGVIITQKIDPNTDKVITQGADGVIYTIKQGDKTILEGTEDAIRKFAQKIDEIRSSGGNTRKKVQSYLDELAESLSLKYSDVLEFRSLKVIKEKGARSNISVLDKEGDVVMKGKQNDIELYLQMMRKSDKEILSKYDELLELAVRTDNKRFNPFKEALEEFRRAGINILPSGKKGGVIGGKGLVPDYLHNPEFLFNKDKRFGSIKIKVTGVDRDDFKLCNEIAEKISPGFKSKISKGADKPDGYAWHHMDDYNPLTGECTMQLVLSDVHTSCFPHKGAPGLIELLFGIKRIK